MARWPSSTDVGVVVRRPAVAGSFYPAERLRLAALVDALLAEADRTRLTADASGGAFVGLLVPHAGLVYSGLVAAAAWRLVAMTLDAPTVVLLGTNHGAAWLDGVAAWETGAWRTPLGDLEVDTDLARAVLDLGSPFTVDRAAHLGEHSIEVQLPFLQRMAPAPRIVPLSVAAGVGDPAIAAGARLGALLDRRRAAGQRVVLAISSDMAHYPPSIDCARATAALLPAILDLDPVALADTERAVSAAGVPGLVCGMCGIQPTILGLAALRAMGATRGSRLAAATSADASGSTHRTVGYLAAAFQP
ncbi:MAG: AmmeMemoRadiSam system protein B [Candidatus Limnocylindrales bacterium]